jgi:hypothetical protein
MSRASRLATSTTRTDVQSDRKAFVTLRFAGDELDLREISAILPVEPTRAHRKGEEFFAGPKAGNLRGRTGIWLLATDKLVASDDLADHLHFVEDLLYPQAGDSSLIQSSAIFWSTRTLSRISPAFGAAIPARPARQSRLSSNPPLRHWPPTSKPISPQQIRKVD